MLAYAQHGFVLSQPCLYSFLVARQRKRKRQSIPGNEKAALELDNTRPIHYEPDAYLKTTDIMSEMYTKEEQMEEIAHNRCHIHSMALWAPFGHLLTPRMYKNKPFIQCEYAHCMGNSLGNFEDYWKHFRNNDRLCGGYIWDFADQAIKRVNQDGVVEYTYGGDWGISPTTALLLSTASSERTEAPIPRSMKSQKFINKSNSSAKVTKSSLRTNICLQISTDLR